MSQALLLEQPEIQESAPPAPVAGPCGKVAYIMSRFPKLTETFILYEILALQEGGVGAGVAVEIYPLLRARNSTTHPEGAGLWTKFRELFRRPNAAAAMHPEAAALVEGAHYHPLFSLQVVIANLVMLCSKPVKYLRTLWDVVRANWGSWNYLIGGLVIFPKTVMTARRMQREGISHVHAHFANHPAAAAYIIHRLTGIPYSFTAHGADLQVDQHMLEEKVRDAKEVVTISHYNRHLILAVCGEEYAEKVRVIHCGVDPASFAANDRPREPNGGRFEIICIGTMYEVKGQTHLIEACRLLKQRNIDLRCHFVGDGPDRETLEEQMHKAGLAEEVIFHGQLVRGEIMELLARVQALVLPSVPTACGRQEGIPVVLMEAMAAGLPVVASGISGIPELVTDGKNGLLVPPREPAAIAGALETLCNDAGLRRRLGRTGRETVVSEFNLRKNALMLRELFTGGRA